MGFVKFMASMAGRMARVLAGVALMVVGLVVVRGTGGYVLAGVGLLPLAAGALDFCVVAPLFGLPLPGRAVREIQSPTG